MISMCAQGGPVQLQTLTGHTSDVNSCDFSRKGLLASGSSDKTVRIWSWKAGQGFVEVPFSPLRDHKYGVTCVHFSPYGTMLATGSIDGNAILWDSTTGEKLATFTQPGSSTVRACRFAPSSSLLVTGGDSSVVCVWDVAAKILQRTYVGHEGAIFAVAFTPDSNCMVTACSQGLMKLWDVGCGYGKCLLAEENVHDLGVTSCDFSSKPITNREGEGTLYTSYLLATCGNDHIIKLWCVTLGVQHSLQCLNTLQGHSASVMCVRFSPSGDRLASAAGDKTVRIWKNTGHCVHVLEGHYRYVTSCSFSHDNRALCTGSNDKTIVVWDLTGQLTINHELYSSGAFMQNFFAKTMNNDESVKHYYEEQFKLKVSQGRTGFSLKQALNTHEGDVTACEFKGSDVLATASSDKVVRIWTKDANGNFLEGKSLAFHSYGVNCINFSPHGSLIASGSVDGTVVICNFETGEKMGSLFHPTSGAVRSCQFSSDGRMLATGDDENGYVWDVTSQEMIRKMVEHEAAIMAVAFSPDNSILVTTCSNGYLKVWNPIDPTGKSLVTQREAHELGVLSCSFSKKFGIQNLGLKTYLLATCGNDSLVKLWHVTTGNGYTIELVQRFEGHGSGVMCVRFSPSGMLLASAAGDKAVRIWDVPSAQCLHVLEGHNRYVTCCCFAADGIRLASGSSDRVVNIWEFQKRQDDNAENSASAEIAPVGEWTSDQVQDWLHDVGLDSYSQVFAQHNVTGEDLLSLTDVSLQNRLGIDNVQQRKEILSQLHWLRGDDPAALYGIEDDKLPSEFLCPITLNIMKEPVLCADGHTYEKAAITEWFVAGKTSSPMTNLPLTHQNLTANLHLQQQIADYLSQHSDPQT